MKDIGFTGVFRLIFKPLVDEFPCFGAVCYSLRQKVCLFFFRAIFFKLLKQEVACVPMHALTWGENRKAFRRVYSNLNTHNFVLHPVIDFSKLMDYRTWACIMSMKR